MEYKFRCKCGKEMQVEIPMRNYFEEKNKVFCPDCGQKMERVLEWEGPAENLGGYSDVAGKAGWQ